MPHARGDTISLRADIQNRLEDFALSNLMGASRPGQSVPFAGAVVATGINKSAELMDRDTVATVGLLSLDPHIHPQARREPTIDVTIPAWPDALGRSAIVLEPIAPNASGPVAIGGYCCASVKITKVSDRFAAADPETPGVLRSSDTGEFRIVAMAPGAAVDETRVCLVCFDHAPCVLWRYERISDEWAASQLVKLMRLDGDQFGDGEVTLLDDLALMDDQGPTDEGLMNQVGNQFIAINAPCDVTEPSTSSSSS